MNTYKAAQEGLELVTRAAANLGMTGTFLICAFTEYNCCPECGSENWNFYEQRCYSEYPEECFGRGLDNMDMGFVRDESDAAETSAKDPDAQFTIALNSFPLPPALHDEVVRLAQEEGVPIPPHRVMRLRKIA